ncbi:Uma2 family endonuclease [Streptomyces sp. NPDC047130]|uniref:Uma2 family endonuclease n=1 Tax=Streptomyces sp. NPDC047130 TaxID=3155261 RepID=UPI0033E8BB16
MSVAYDHVGPWTVDDVLALGEDTHQRVELVGGALLMSPAPSVPHQRASRRLAALLERAADEAGADVEVLEAVNISVPDGLLIPDLVVADAEAAGEAGVVLNNAAVLLVVEIASPATRLTDRKLKPALYAAAGIEHYWRVDLEPAPTLHTAVRNGSGYRDLATVLPGQTVRIDEPFPLTIDPARLAR